MKKGFTLVELLVVIGILGVLSAALMMSFSGVGDKAKMVKCASNMRGLAQAINSAAVGGSYPYAQSALYFDVGGSTTLRMRYYVHKGWISWLDRNVTYPLSSENGSTQPSYAGSDENVNYAITNGAIWQVVGKSRDVYVCPAHLDACRAVGVQHPGWSYVMNAKFGYESAPGKAAASSTSVIRTGSLSRADRTLLLAEIPALTLTNKDRGAAKVSDAPDVNLTGGDGSSDMDTCLQSKSYGGNESMGFNHRKGKQIVGHVAFADGHVEAIALPKDGNFEDLTDWLCTGEDIIFRNGSYEKLTD